jgi:hypothetical protein
VLGIDDAVAEDLRPKAKAVLEQMLDSSDESKRLAAGARAAIRRRYQRDDRPRAAG